MEQINNQPTEVEIIKSESNLLRGTINEGMTDKITGAISPRDTQLIKFHGSYQQTDRDLDSERKKQKLEPLYSFMIRVRLPGGILTSAQWRTIDSLAGRYGSGTLKLTTRQTIQLHCVLKRNLKNTIREINDALLTTLATCGDVNRNVMCSPNHFVSGFNKEVLNDARLISSNLLPQTKAYHEIWLGKEIVAGGEPESEPVYGNTYLPRKFKIAITIPPYNDTDVFSNDIGLIAIKENDRLAGYNVIAGGGMGMSFENRDTHPRLGDILGYIPREKVVKVITEILNIQRDKGNRSDRKFGRLKYTIESMGPDNFKKELTDRLGFTFEPAKKFRFVSNNDRFGWYQGKNKLWHLCLFIEGGRVLDSGNNRLRTAIQQISEKFDPEIIITGNQNLIISNIETACKQSIEEILNSYTVRQELTGLRKHSLACVALNTCPLAYAEAERYLPKLIDKIDILLIQKGLREVPINIRMTGCPNGCARPYLGEIGLVGRVVGKYNLYLGADHKGTRLNFLYREMVDEAAILEILSTLFEQFSKERISDEHFGDFVVRKKIAG